MMDTCGTLFSHAYDMRYKIVSQVEKYSKGKEINPRGESRVGMGESAMAGSLLIDVMAQERVFTSYTSIPTV
jgi:hypothetical protein